MTSRSSLDKQADSDKGKSYDEDVVPAETNDIYTDAAIDPVYQAKARILNDALQEIGMGRYQVCIDVCICVIKLTMSAVVPIHRRWLRMVRVRTSS